MQHTTRTTPRQIAAAALVASAALLPLATPSPASAGAILATYDVAFDGAWSYHATELSPGVMDAVRISNASWKSASTQPVTFTRAATQQTAVTPMASSEPTFTGSYVENIHGIHPVQQVCNLTLDGPAGEGIAGASTDDQGTVTLDLQPVDHFPGTQHCKYPTPITDIALLGRDLSTKVTFPADRLGEDVLTFPVASGAGQPCWSYALTTSCTATWSGTVTLTKRSSEDPAPTPAPAPAPGPGGQATPPVKPAPKPGRKPTKKPTKPGKGGVDWDSPEVVVPLADDWFGQEIPSLIDDWFQQEIPPLVEPEPDLVAPLVSPAEDARFEPSRGKLGFRADCAGGCSGTATLTTTGRAAKGHRATRLAAGAAQPTRHVTMRFQVAAGAHLVVLKLGTRARANLKHARCGTLELTLRDRASKQTTTALRILRMR